MSQPATFYYEADIVLDKNRIAGIPILAAHAGDNEAEPWHSGIVKNGAEFKNIFERVHAQVPLYIVVLQTNAVNFPKDREIPRLVLTAWKPMPNVDYKTGTTISLSVMDIKVTEAAPIHAAKLPGIPSVQRRYLEKKHGTQMYRLLEVGLFVSEAEVQI